MKAASSKGSLRFLILRRIISFASAMPDSSSARSSWRIFALALGLTTMESQPGLGLCCGEVSTSTLSPLFSTWRSEAFLPLTLPEMALAPTRLWMAKAKSSSVAPSGSLRISPMGVKT